jgi:hypothetical protein
MSSTYSTNLKLELIANGEQAGTWGTTTNTNLGTLIEQAISGYVTQSMAAGTVTLTMDAGASCTARNIFLELTSAVAASTLTLPTNRKLYFVYNNSGYSATVKTSGTTGVTVPNGAKYILVCNGSEIINATTYMGYAGTPTNTYIPKYLSANLGFADSIINESTYGIGIGAVAASGQRFIVKGTSAESVVFDSGSAGYGRLQLDYGASNTSYLASYEQNAATTLAPFIIAGSALTLNSTTGINLNTGTSSATRAITVNSSGNVGINLTSVSYPLDVGGHARITGSLEVNALSTPGTATGTLASGGGLGSGLTYYFRIVATDGAGAYTVGSSESTGVTTTSTNKTINLTWTASTGASGYFVLFTTTSGSYTSLSAFFTTTNSYSFTTTAGATTGVLPTINTTGTAKVGGNSVFITTSKTPSSATDTGTTGQICWDSSYVYVCVATNTWKRAALATW